MDCGKKPANKIYQWVNVEWEIVMESFYVQPFFVFVYVSKCECFYAFVCVCMYVCVCVCVCMRARICACVKKRKSEDDIAILPWRKIASFYYRTHFADC